MLFVTENCLETSYLPNHSDNVKVWYSDMMEYYAAIKTLFKQYFQTCDPAQDRILNKQDTKLPIMSLIFLRAGCDVFTFFSMKKETTREITKHSEMNKTYQRL